MPAFVEKVINSIDAMLMLECQLHGLSLEGGEETPESMADAAQLFFKVPNGRLEAGQQLPLTFELPDDPELVNRLSERPVSYWQVVVEGNVGGADHRSLFFVPVYS